MSKNYKNELMDVIRENYKNLKESSVKIYAGKFMNFQKKMGIINSNLNLPNDLEFSRDFNKVDTSISQLSDNTRRCYFIAVGKLLVLYPESFEREINHYSQLERNLKEIIDNKRKENKKTPFEVENWIDWENLQKVPSMIKSGIIDEDTNEKDYDIYQDYIISLLYLKSEYLIRLDWHSTELVFNKDDLDTNKNQLLVGVELIMYLNDFKNVKTFGKFNWTFNNTISLEIREWLNYKKNINNTHLLYDKNKIFDDVTLSVRIKQITKDYTGKVINLNLLRKIRSTNIEEYIKKSPGMSFKEKENLHKKLCHGLEEGMLYYKK